MEVKEKFLADWKILFPGAELPDTSFFVSKVSFENEFLSSQKRINKLKIELQKEEFLLNTLHKYKDDKVFLNSLEKRKSSYIGDEQTPRGHLLSISEQLASPNKFEVLDATNDTTFSFSSFKPINKSGSKSSLNEPDILSFSTSWKASENEPDLSSFSLSSKSLSFDGGLEVDEEKTEIHIKMRRSTDPEAVKYLIEDVPVRRCTDPAPDTLRPIKPKPAPRSLPRNSTLNPVPDPVPRRVSLDSLTSDKNLVSNKEQWRKTTGGLLDLSKPAKVLPANIEDTENPPNTNIIQEYDTNNVSDDDEEDDPVYTDISDLKMKKPPVTLPSQTEPVNHVLLENQEQLYENANMKPTIEKLADAGSEDEISSVRKKDRKRLGSQDRQGYLFSDDLDVTTSTGDSQSDLDVILNGSQESLVDDFDDDVEVTPSIVVETHGDENYYDDDEHIYANVDDLCIKVKDSDNDSGSDNDFLCDSYSGGIPSPNYREMTSAEIESLKKNESDDDLTQSQGMNYMYLYV